MFHVIRDKKLRTGHKIESKIMKISDSTLFSMGGRGAQCPR